MERGLTERVSLKISPEMMAVIKDIAHKEFRSINQQIIYLIHKALKAEGIDVGIPIRKSTGPKKPLKNKAAKRVRTRRKRGK